MSGCFCRQRLSFFEISMRTTSCSATPSASFDSASRPTEPSGNSWVSSAFSTSRARKTTAAIRGSRTSLRTRNTLRAELMPTGTSTTNSFALAAELCDGSAAGIGVATKHNPRTHGSHPDLFTHRFTVREIDLLGAQQLHLGLGLVFLRHPLDVRELNAIGGPQQIRDAPAHVEHHLRR